VPVTCAPLFSSFLARAVADGLLDEKYLKKFDSKSAINPSVRDVIDTATKMLVRTMNVSRLRRAWGMNLRPLRAPHIVW
jgi:hypothetical protein